MPLYNPPGTVSGNSTIGGTLNVTGATTLSSTLAAGATTITGAATVSTTLGVTGIVSANGGTKTSSSAPALTPTFANGVASQLSDLTRDYMVYFEVGTAGTAFTVSIGPTSSPANAVVTSGTATSGECVSFRLPAGWFVQWAMTTGTLANQIAIGC